MSFALVAKAMAGATVMSLAGASADAMKDVLANVQKSVTMIEFQAIDRALQRDEVLNSINKSKSKFPANQEKFEKFMNESFEQKNIRDNMKDQWGTDIQYERAPKDDGYTIVSAGPDLTFTTEDDLILKRKGHKIELNANPLTIMTEEITKAIEREKERAEQIQELNNELQAAGIDAMDGLSEAEKQTLQNILSTL